MSNYGSVIRIVRQMPILNLRTVFMVMSLWQSLREFTWAQIHKRS